MGTTSEIVIGEQAQAMDAAPQLECYKVDHLPPSRLVANDLNKETFYSLESANYSTLRVDIEKRGIVCPLVVNASMVLLAGHQRWKIARSLQLETVPVIIRKDLDDDAQREFLLVDNLTGRQLSLLELSNVATQLWNLYEGRHRGRPAQGGAPQEIGKTRDLVGQRMGRSGRSVEDLRKLQELSPADRERLHSGEIGKTEAFRILRRKQGGQEKRDTSKALVAAARSVATLTDNIRKLVDADPTGDCVRPMDVRQLRKNVEELARYVSSSDFDRWCAGRGSQVEPPSLAVTTGNG